jgi:hypothetical protein
MGGILRNQIIAPNKRYVPKNKKHEEGLQKQVCSYLRMQYPHVIFRSDYASGLRLTMFQAATHKSLQSGRAWVDLFLYEPRVVDGVQYAGLAIELKKEGTAIVVTKGPRKGHIVSNPHIQEQVLMIKELKRRGYQAEICCGFRQAITAIDKYMGKPQTIGMF